MKRSVIQGLLVVGLLGAGVPVAVMAEEGAKTLPTLLIKGEVVSVDTADAAAPLLKVKDRYGFETPIYLGQTTKVSKGDQALQASDLTQGTAVEVEYNFDINTAKRHAVSVKVGAEAPAAAAPVESAAPMAPAPTDEPVPAMDDTAGTSDVDSGMDLEAPAAEPTPETPATNTAQ